MTERTPPDRYRVVGAVHVVSGVLNLTAAWWCASMASTTLGGCCVAIGTLGNCPWGALLGTLPFLLIPLGFLEILGGAMMLARDPSGSTALARVLPLLEVASVLVGGTVAPVAGMVALALRDDAVRAYLEG